MVNQLPTIFHITHVKSGSQWVYQVLLEAAPRRIVRPRMRMLHFFGDSILPGMIYPTVYVARGRFEAALRPTSPPESFYAPASQNYRNFVQQDRPIKTFVVLRDLRDTLVSYYFSLKVSHVMLSDIMTEGSQKLNDLDIEQGLLYLCGDVQGSRSEQAMPIQAEIQRSWLPVCDQGGALLVRYEDLIADEQAWFAKIAEYCEMDISKSRLEEIVAKNSFSNKAGRKRGEEDASSHYRKGISGDWRNHFSDRLKEKFKQAYGQLLIETGYEKDLDW
ncbi:MAG: sulfotransferase domain-containing protein [Chloroflexi bacterium]|nr:sulfotransferase domain-containing protein [Chloroflexota bacterium]